MSSILNIVALNQVEMKVMLDDGVMLAIRKVMDDTNNEVEWGVATAILVVDHRIRPPSFARIELSAIDFAGEVN